MVTSTIQQMKKYLPVIILISFFFIYKLSNLGIRLSDSNIYFYTGYELLQGKTLYRDIFFTNFPLIPYLSSLYFLITGGSLKLFFITPAIEVSIITFLVYKISFEKSSRKLIAITSSALYLFSFIILSTSDHQSGVFFASLMAVLSYYFYTKNKYLLSGISIAFTLLAKAYFIPIALSIGLLFLIDKKWKDLVRFAAGALFAGLIVMLPTVVFAFPDFINNVFEYSLTRSQGIDKTRIFWFAITHDFPLFLIFIFNLFLINQNKFFGLVSLFSILFLILYQDVYYLYLNLLIPFLCLSYYHFHQKLNKVFDLPNGFLLIILSFFFLYNFISYHQNFRDLQKINNIEQIANIIKKENPRFLYGTNDIVPALSYLSHTPLLNKVIDTNANIYRRGILDADQMTADAIKQKSIIVTHGVFYPDQGVRIDTTDEIFDKGQIEKSCTLIDSFPVQTEGIENRLNLFRCF